MPFHAALTLLAVSTLAAVGGSALAAGCVATLLLLLPARRRRAVMCHVAHPWYRVARVPVGFADWTETWACKHCGDRVCKHL